MQGQDKSLTALARADQRAKWLVTIPGIGSYSAMILLAEIDEIGRFGTAKACLVVRDWCLGCASRPDTAIAVQSAGAGRRGRAG